MKSSIKPINPNPNIHIRPITISGPTLLLVSPVISIATIINIPPIVGVPFLAKCVFGPSSLTV